MANEGLSNHPSVGPQLMRRAIAMLVVRTWGAFCIKMRFIVPNQVEGMIMFAQAWAAYAHHTENVSRLGCAPWLFDERAAHA